MDGTEQAVSKSAEACLAGDECFAARRAVAHIRQEPHQPCHPQREIGQRHPRLFHRGLLQNREEQAENCFLGIALGKHFIQQLSKKAEDCHAHMINGGRKG